MDKKTGYLLLAAGVAVLIGGAALVGMTLYGGLPAPRLFNAEAAVTMALSQGGTMSVPLPPHINTAANLAVFFTAVFLLAVIGAKIGRLGVHLIQKPQSLKEEPPKRPADTGSGERGDKS
ncbi:MAG: hypothetical protein KKH28_05445 [Elusimicrobia bacterium]|nr:hypothetical protein [Elusimicrobiota bacterium]